MSVFHMVAEKQAAQTALDARSLTLRNKIIKVLDDGGRGHLGASFSIVEIVRVLYDHILKFNPLNPEWPDRDRFILSKGHGCITQYVLLAENAFFPAEELSRFCKHNALLGGHPSFKVPGIEAATGSLGHGLPIGVGIALNARIEKKHYKTVVLIGDGESNEGSIWEAALCAGKHRLDDLTVMIDYNKYQSYDATSVVQDLEPIADKWQSFGFGVREVDGHDVDALKSTLNSLPVVQNKPSAIICHTIKGKGVSFAENNLEWHHKSRIPEDLIQSLYQELEVTS